MTRSTRTRAVLMGDPAHFSVQGGANPHTRTRWGNKRQVDRTRAIEQWGVLKRQLEALGIRVLVVPPDPAQPGLVYPANAGFQFPLDADKPLSEKIFTLSNLLPTRAGEKAHYRRLLEAEGFQLHEIDEHYRFEGEADFFPVGELFALTHGRLEKQRFVPHIGLPPWKRVYGFRTDERVEPLLREVVGNEVEILHLELILEAHYHGDTALCAFGPRREHLLVYRDALSPDSLARLEQRLGPALVTIPREDAERYAANSFSYTDAEGSSYLVMPGGVSAHLLGEIRERGTTPITIDVSEFLKKGGGSVKCMIGDLGIIFES